MAVRASSLGSGRTIRSSSVCQSRSTSSARRRSSCGVWPGERWGSSGAHDVGDLAQQLQHRAAAGLGGVGGEDRPVLQPVQDVGDQVPVDGARRPAPRPIRRAVARQRAVLGAAAISRQRCSCSVMLTSWKYAVKARARTTAVASSTPSQLGVQLRRRRCSRASAPDLLDQGEQLGALVAGQRLAEQLTELTHRGPQRRVLAVGGHPARELAPRRAPVAPPPPARRRSARATRHRAVGATLLRHGRQSDGCL